MSAKVLREPGGLFETSEAHRVRLPPSVLWRWLKAPKHAWTACRGRIIAYSASPCGRAATPPQACLTRAFTHQAGRRAGKFPVEGWLQAAEAVAGPHDPVVFLAKRGHTLAAAGMGSTRSGIGVGTTSIENQDRLEAWGVIGGGVRASELGRVAAGLV